MTKALIAMPVFNHYSELGEAIESIMKQSTDNYKLVVCDDCSTDGSFELLKDYQKRFDFTLLKNDVNLGTGRTVNRIYDEHLGDSQYLTWISSDNIYSVNFVENHISNLDSGTCFSFSDWDSIGSISHGYRCDGFYKEMVVSNAYRIGPSFMFTKELWYKTGPYVSTPGEDWVFALKAYMHGAKFKQANGVLMKYRAHNNCVGGRIRAGQDIKLSTPIIDYLRSCL